MHASAIGRSLASRIGSIRPRPRPQLTTRIGVAITDTKIYHPAPGVSIQPNRCAYSAPVAGFRSRGGGAFEEVLINLIKFGVSFGIFGYLVYDAVSDDTFAQMYGSAQALGLLRGGLGPVHGRLPA